MSADEKNVMEGKVEEECEVTVDNVGEKNIPAAKVEAAEEAKLRSRFPLGGKPMAGHSAFLQKRLTKGLKYFDSGDYQMARQSNPSRMPPLLAQPTGETIPTPDSVPVRKTSIIQHTKLTSAS